MLASDADLCQGEGQNAVHGQADEAQVPSLEQTLEALDRAENLPVPGILQERKEETLARACSLETLPREPERGQWR